MPPNNLQFINLKFYVGLNGCHLFCESCKSSKTNANVYSRALRVLFGKVVMCVLAVEFNSATTIILDMHYEAYTIFTQFKYSFGMKKLFRGKSIFHVFFHVCTNLFAHLRFFFAAIIQFSFKYLPFYLCLLLSTKKQFIFICFKFTFYYSSWF